MSKGVSVERVSQVAGGHGREGLKEYSSVGDVSWFPMRCVRIDPGLLVTSLRKKKHIGRRLKEGPVERTVNSSKFGHHAFAIFKVSAFSVFGFEGQSVPYSIVPCYGL